LRIVADPQAPGSARELGPGTGIFPDQPFELGKMLEMNDHHVRLVGIRDALARFIMLPIVFTRYIKRNGSSGQAKEGSTA